MKLTEAISKKTYRPKTSKTEDTYFVFDPQSKLYLRYLDNDAAESGDRHGWVRDPLLAERFILSMAKWIAREPERLGRAGGHYHDSPSLVIHKARITVRVSDEIDPFSK